MSNPEMLDSIPDTVPEVEGNTVTHIEVDPSKLELHNGEPVIRNEQSEIKLIYKETSGWVMPQFETATTQVFLDWDYTHNEGDNNPDDRELVYSIEPTTDINVFRGDSQFNYLFLSNTGTDWYDDVRGGIDNIAITGNNFDGVSSIDNHMFTVFTMLQESNGVPSDESIQAVREKYLNTNEDLIVQVDGSDWNLREGVEIIFDANRGDHAIIPSDYATVNENGKLILHIMPGVGGSWDFGSSLLTVSDTILNNEGIEGDLDEERNGDENYSSTFKSLFPITASNGSIVPPFTIRAGSSNGTVRTPAFSVFNY